LWRISSQSFEYLKSLQGLKLGYFIIDELREEMNKSTLPVVKQTNIQFAWCEITEACNLKCIHCYSDSSPSVSGLYLSEGEWKNILKEIYETGCRRLQFIGGEPFTRRNLLQNLIEHSRLLGFQYVEVYSNCTLIDQTLIEFLSERHVKIATTVYSCDSAIHDTITQSPGSFVKTITNIKRIIEMNIPLRVGLVEMKQNTRTIPDTYEYLKSIGVRNIKIDMVRSAGRGCNNELLPDELVQKQLRSKPSFPPCYEVDFNNAHSGHNCFAKKICITANGNVLPCIMERNIVFGNLRKNRLLSILNTPETQKVRFITKDQIDICRDCEYRYCCFDCRIQASSLLGKPSNCSYNPYTGEWLKSFEFQK